MITLTQLQALYKEEKEEILRDLFTYLRFASIATDPAYKKEVIACANWLETYLKGIGLKVEKWQTSGSPIIFATHDSPEKHAETVLIYCHYDVQPVDPLNLWITPPFEPTIREGAVFARGALDDKGQSFYTIRALKSCLEKIKPLNLNIKLLIEGEEESGSSSLFSLLEEKKQQLKADHILIVDSGLQKEGQPAITLGARGIVCMDVSVTGSKFDLHSGTHGGIVYNPNRALVELLASLHEDRGRVAITGFYDDILEMTADEKKAFTFSFDQEYLLSHFEAKPAGMEQGYSPLESAWLRPTLEINGISGGYSGTGFKTVIPAVAKAKISCRLVPGQDPDKIAQLVKNHIVAKKIPGMKITCDILEGKGKATRTNPHSKLASIFAAAYEAVFQKPCDRILIGGSIPVAADLAAASGGEMLLIGMGLAEDQIHAPNEHFGLNRLEQGYLTLALGLQLLAQKK